MLFPQHPHGVVRRRPWELGRLQLLFSRTRVPPLGAIVIILHR